MWTCPDCGERPAHLCDLMGGPGGFLPAADDAVSVGLLTAIAGYLYAATGTVYGERGSMRVFKTLILTVAAACFFPACRFILLPITRYSA